MEEIIKKVFNEKLNDGSIEKIVGEKIEDMISSILHDQMSWSGEVKKELEKRIKPIMLKAVSDCDLSKTASIVTDLLNQSVKTTPIHLMKDTYDGIKTLFSVNEEAQNIVYGKKIKLSDIFAVYTRSIENKSYDEYDFNQKDIDIHNDYDEEGKYAYIDTSMEVENTTEYNLWGKSKNKYEVTLTNNFDNEKIVFGITESYNSELRIDLNTEGMLLAELRYLPPIIVYLIQLKNNWCNIDIDTESEVDEVKVTVD